MVRYSKPLLYRRQPLTNVSARLVTIPVLASLLLMSCGHQSSQLIETDPFESERARQRDQILLQDSRKQRLYGSSSHQTRADKSVHHTHVHASKATFGAQQHPRPKPVFARPVEAAHVTSQFGFRTDPFGSNRLLFHNGIDFSATTGTLVRAGAAGRIIAVGYRRDGCGLSVSVLHQDEYVSEFCHLERARVTLHQSVQLGSVVGEVGTTGHTTGPHLHWTLWRQGVALNPEHFLTEAQP